MIDVPFDTVQYRITSCPPAQSAGRGSNERTANSISPTMRQESHQEPRQAHRVSRYHPVLVTLHWLLAVLIIAALALGALVMAKLPNTDPMKIETLRHHMTGGFLILVLMLVRLLVRARTSHPTAAPTGHWALDRL